MRVEIFNQCRYSNPLHRSAVTQRDAVPIRMDATTTWFQSPLIKLGLGLVQFSNGLQFSGSDVRLGTINETPPVGLRTMQDWDCGLCMQDCAAVE
jgi:hypothetical protein